jgi:hypothetical protein
MASREVVVKFGKRVAELRSKGFPSLRDFCRKWGYDPVEVNKWEEGLAPAPDRDKAHFLAVALGLREDSVEYDQFLLLADEAREGYEPVPLGKAELFRKVPVAFRGLKVGEGEEPSDVVDQAKRIAREIHDAEPKP